MQANDLIAEYIKIKDHLEQQTKKFSDYCAPFRQRQEEIQNKLLEMLNALGGDGKQALKADAGTAYLSRIVTPKIVDREKYLDAVIDNYHTFGSGMLQLGAPKKEAVDDYMASHEGHLPDGVEISSIIRCNIRRS